MKLKFINFDIPKIQHPICCISWSTKIPRKEQTTMKEWLVFYNSKTGEIYNRFPLVDITISEIQWHKDLIATLHNVNIDDISYKIL